MGWGYTIIFPFVSVFSNFYTMKDLCDLKKKKKTALPANQLLRTHSSYTVSESESHSVMSDSLQPHGLYSPWNSPGRNTGVGSLSLLQGIFPAQGSNPGLPHCRQILYQLSQKGSPRIPEWVAYPSPGVHPDPGIEPGSPALQTDSLPSELSGKPWYTVRDSTKIWFQWSSS